MYAIAHASFHIACVQDNLRRLIAEEDLLVAFHNLGLACYARGLADLADDMADGNSKYNKRDQGGHICGANSTRSKFDDCVLAPVGDSDAVDDICQDQRMDYALTMDLELDDAFFACLSSELLPMDASSK